MANLIVSAHGGRWSNQRDDLTVPNGSAVAYYVPDGGVLKNADGYRILDELQRGNEPGGKVVELIEAGKPTYDYACWYAPEFAGHCGIYEVGSRTLVESLKPYTADKPLWLREIFARYPDRVVYWVCCREVSDPQQHTQLTVAPGSFLTEPAPAPA